MKEEREEKAFKITDKRFSVRSQEAKEAPKTEAKKEPERVKEEKERLENRQESRRKAFPEINFATFIISLSSQAMFHFGDFPDPITKKTEKNLPLAKQTIDIISMLQEKTKGNLNSEEAQLMDNILYELRWRYVKQVE